MSSNDAWENADWGDEDAEWSAARAEDASAPQIALPSIETASSERLRRLESLKAAAVPPPPVAAPAVDRGAPGALAEQDGNGRVASASPPCVRAPATQAAAGFAADSGGEEKVELKFYPSGGRYEGPLDAVTAQPQGIGVFYYPIGHRYEGPWENGQKQGERGTFFFANGSRYEGAWKANERHGLGVQFQSVRASATPHTEPRGFPRFRGDETRLTRGGSVCVCRASAGGRTRQCGGSVRCTARTALSTWKRAALAATRGTTSESDSSTADR